MSPFRRKKTNSQPMVPRKPKSTVPGYLIPLLKRQIPDPRRSKIRSWGIKVRKHVSKFSRASGIIRSRFKKANRPSLDTTDKDIYEEENTSKFLQLPEELLLEIMGRLPASSLYFLRQTCNKFRRISSDRNFDSFNRMFAGPAKEPLAVGGASYKQLGMARDFLARKYHCRECTRLRDTGALKQKMMDLYKPMYCKGCRVNHPALFFPRIHRQKKSQGGELCVGHLGEFTLCSHLSFYWSELSAFRHSPGLNGITCKHSNHIPQQILARNNDEVEVICPGISASPSETGSRTMTLRANRSLYLLQLDCNLPISIDDLREKLGLAIDKLPGDAKLCGHCPSMGHELLECLSSSKCDCFPPSGLPVSTKRRCISHPSCKNHKFTCRHCGVNYSWSLKDDASSYWRSYVVLRINCLWLGVSPTSLELLSCFNYDSYNKSIGHETGNPVFDESTRHVLWCDSPGCATGAELRWLRMAKTFLYETRKTDIYKPWTINSDYAPRSVSIEHEAFAECKQWGR
ncbi:hypothetical protein EDB80DRAFT_899412 [Ilyonectria destructans]|nr:hypothetical protein EDB80DRAFT_899412 [Ilyonectria destructans]